MDAQMFKTAFSGFNKEEVVEYINKLKEQNVKDSEALNKRIAELEDTAAAQVQKIQEKNIEIEELYVKLDEAQQRAGGKLTEMSSLVDRLNDNEKILRREFDAKEFEYKKKISQLEKTISENEDSFKADKAETEERHNNIVEKLKAELEKEYLDKVEYLTKNYDAETSRLKKEYERELEHAKMFHAADLRNLKQEHEDELNRVESSNQKAMDFAKAEVSELKSSLDAVKSIEENAKAMAEKLIEETKAKCEEEIRRNEEEIARRKEDAQRELDECQTALAKTMERLNELVSLVECNRDRFVVECDRVKQALNRYR